MEGVGGPIFAGIVVSLINRYLLDFKWCGLLESWCEDDNEENETDSNVSPSSSTAISSDMFLTHHLSTHVY